MIEKALICIIFVYAASFSLLAVQYVIGDVYGITLTNYKGEEIRSDLLNVTNMATINSVTSNIATGNYTLTDVAAAFIAAGNVVVQLLIILTGTYIFNVLYLLGVPAIMIVGMVAIYVFLLARAIIALIRGV